MPLEHDLSHLAWSHWDTRQFVIRLQTAETPAGSIVLLGDSIIEGLWTNTLPVHGRACLAVNAGFAGIGVTDLQRMAAPLLAGWKPRFAVLYVGINDAWPDADAASWAARYDALVETILRSGATAVLSTILPPEPGIGRTTKSPQTVERFNDAIRAVGKSRGLLVADIANAAPEAGSANVHLTTDGIHPTGAFYRSLVEQWLVPALDAAQGARHEDCISSF
ncbi:MAG: SGNH/GDSL hydrolase family protein [Pseudomonadota bacterium]|nr:SGNH/GDSL hydrolase family protein [Pseudomonadota bacterium]